MVYNETEKQLDPIAYLSPNEYKKIYDRLKQYIVEKQVVVPRLGEKSPTIIGRFDAEIRGFILKELKLSQSTSSMPIEIQERIDTVVNDMDALIRGFGPLQPYMEGATKRNVSSPVTIEEIVVRNGCILLEAGGQISTALDTTNDILRQQEINSQFEILAKRIADDQKQPVSLNKPYSVVTIPDTGDRLGVIIPPLAKNFVAINIRVFPRGNPYTLENLQDKGAFADFQEIKQTDLLKRKPVNSRDQFLSDLISDKQIKPSNTTEKEDVKKTLWEIGREARIRKMLDTISDDEMRRDFEKMSRKIGNQVALFLGYFAYLNLGTVLVSGEFSSGKTSLLNAMSYFIRDDILPVAIEDYIELKIPHKYILRLETSKIFDQGVVLNTVLTRMRPDLIIVGELVEKGQSFEFLNASNLGKKAWSTIHSNNAYGALIRLENLATIEGYTPYEIRRRIVNSVDMVVHMAQESGYRFVNEISLVNKELNKSGDYALTGLYNSFRKGIRAELIGALWDGIKEQD